jgi:hypothetical protein
MHPDHVNAQPDLMGRDRDPDGRARNARPRDALGRPLSREEEGVERIPDDYAPGAEQAVAHAGRLLEEDRPFHAHEVLEARWKSGPEDERDLWQGLAQICVGLTHLQRDNAPGAAALLVRGAERVHGYGATAYGIDLTELVRVSRLLAGSGTVPSQAIAMVRRTLPD